MGLLNFPKHSQFKMNNQEKPFRVGSFFQKFQETRHFKDVQSDVTLQYLRMGFKGLGK